jgi:hypothetical protein
MLLSSTEMGAKFEVMCLEPVNTIVTVHFIDNFLFSVWMNM